MTEIGNDPDGDEETAILKRWQTLNKQQAALKKKRKQADEALDAAAFAQYADLTEADIKALVVDDKWLATLEHAILGETARSSRELTRRVRELADRYAAPLPTLQDDVDSLQAKVDKHLEKMGFAWT